MLETIPLPGPAGQVAALVIGLIVLILGRKLFWLFVAAVGFIVGLYLAVQYFSQLPDWLLLLIGLVIGIIGAVVALVVQRVAVAIAGFALGGLLLTWLVRQFQPGGVQSEWLIFLAGGLIGAILALVLLEVALIILSSLAGASLIVQITSFGPLVTLLLFGVLVLIGILIQSRMLQGERAVPPE